MKKISKIILQIFIILMGLAVLVLMLWEPHLEGRNINATLFEIYLKDPFLAYAYIGSIPFFVALYQIFKLIGNKITIEILRNIKYCMITLIAFILGAEAYIFITMRGKDDIAGGVAVGVFIILISGIVAIIASVFERCLKKELTIFS